jgi:hypothetical protein
LRGKTIKSKTANRISRIPCLLPKLSTPAFSVEGLVLWQLNTAIKGSRKKQYVGKRLLQLKQGTKKLIN